MRIGIDGRFYGLGAAGLARYTQELLRGLAALPSKHTFVLFVRQEDVAEVEELPRVEVRVTDIGHYTFAEQLKLGRELKAAKLDLMHFTNFNHPLRYRGPFVVSVNDLTLLRFPGRDRMWRVKTPIMRAAIRSAVKHANLILTLSQHQQDLIAKEFHIAPEKIDVVYLAPDEQFRPRPEPELTDFRHHKGLTGPFVMYTGQWREHKNLVRLIKAFKLVAEETNAKLVFVGKNDPAFPIIPDTVNKEGLTDRVVFTGFVEDAELPLYYSAATVFAFPSLAEGFGLPPLEAMASGTAVVASQAPPMPEILGDAAAYFDPFSTDELAKHLRVLLTDDTARRRHEELGLAQAKKYSWAKTAAETLAAYERALDQPRR